MPPFSRDSQLISRSNRCWGSITVASRGDIPKKMGIEPGDIADRAGGKGIAGAGMIFLGMKK